MVTQDPRSQWSKLPIPTQGQQQIPNHVHRYDLLGPFLVEELGLVKWASGVEFQFPANCMLTDIFAGGSGSIRLVLPDASVHTLTPGQSELSDFVVLDRTNLDGSALAIATPGTVNCTLFNGGPFYIWFAIIRWARGIPFE